MIIPSALFANITNTSNSLLTYTSINKAVVTKITLINRGSTDITNGQISRWNKSVVSDAGFASGNIAHAIYINLDIPASNTVTIDLKIPLDTNDVLGFINLANVSIYVDGVVYY